MRRFSDEAAVVRFGWALADVLRPGDVVTLSGPLGSGKTTVARAVLRGLGHAGEVPSPTFTLVQPYEDAALRLPVWHADLYRLDRAEEARALALDTILDDGALIVEWPERGGREVPGPALALTLDGTGEAARTLAAVVPVEWEARWSSL